MVGGGLPYVAESDQITPHREGHIGGATAGGCHMGGQAWYQGARLFAVWFLSRAGKRAHANKCGLQAPKRKEFRSRLSPSVYLCGGCARVKLALYISSIYV